MIEGAKMDCPTCGAPKRVFTSDPKKSTNEDLCWSENTGNGEKQIVCLECCCK